MLTVLVTSLTPLEEAQQLFQRLITSLSKSAQQLVQIPGTLDDGSNAERGVCTNVTNDSAMVIIPTLNRDVHVLIRLSQSKQDSLFASPRNSGGLGNDGWRNADVIVYTLDLTDR
ncbi:hypothetical protein EON65_32615 [archaeon]|nr:MAG: hypothetical protein EON65_32615 [archaeon]